MAQWLRIYRQCRGHGFESWSRKITHAVEQLRLCVPQLLSLRSRAHEPQLLKPARLEPVLCNKRSHRNEKPHTTEKSSPRSPQLEKARMQKRRPNAATDKNKLINLKKRKHRSKSLCPWVRQSVLKFDAESKIHKRRNKLDFIKGRNFCSSQTPLRK